MNTSQERNASDYGYVNKQLGYKMVGKKVIIRGDKSGVFFGTLKERDECEVLLTDARRIWYWEGAASISQLACEGVKKPEKCKFAMPVKSILLLDAVEITPCTEEATDIIESVYVWKADIEQQNEDVQ